MRIQEAYSHRASTTQERAYNECRKDLIVHQRRNSERTTSVEKMRESPRSERRQDYESQTKNLLTDGQDRKRAAARAKSKLAAHIFLLSP